MGRTTTRRGFLKGAVGAATGFIVVPRRVLGGPGNIPPSERLNVAAIGAGGMGANDIEQVARSANIVALCDVDDTRAAKTFEKFPQARKYRDFRKMLDAENKNIDAVTVSTPDHTHAVAAMTAMQMGKHVYCQKPLAHDIAEVRRLTEAARRYKVVTQMGIQLHATEALKLGVEIIKSGLIGKVRRVDLWSNKDWGGDGTRPAQKPPVPESLDWDLWLGPAPYRDYHPAYLPENWRRWRDFGTGTLGDMGCHIIDPAWWALDLTYPISVEAEPDPLDDEHYPHHKLVQWEFAARGDLPPVTVRWFDGVRMWQLPIEFEDDRKVPDEGGFYYGETATLLLEHGVGPRLIPESRMKEFKRPEPVLPRGVDHYQDWIRGCKGGPKPLANFDYAGPLAETILLGNVAARAKAKIEWDGPGMKVTNMPEANRYLQRAYREGWRL